VAEKEGKIMKQENRETLQRATGILEGISVSEDLSTDMAQILINVSKMLDTVLRKEKEG
jgi:hypothetical protein